MLAAQRRQLRIFADIQCTQIIMLAVQLRQRQIVADIQCTQIINMAVQRRQRRTAADIQFTQVINIAVQLRQRRTAADIQFTQLISIAVQLRQRPMVADIQCTQIINMAVQIPQLRTAADIQFTQLILLAVQIRQRLILADIQFTQLNERAGQLLQRGKIFNALQGTDLFTMQGVHAEIQLFDRRDRRKFTLVQGAIIVVVKLFFYIFAEVRVRKCFGDLNVPGLLALCGGSFLWTYAAFKLCHPGSKCTHGENSHRHAHRKCCTEKSRTLFSHVLFLFSFVICRHLPPKAPSAL